MTRPPKSKAIEHLRKALDAIPELKQQTYDSPKFDKWQRDTRVAISHTFGNVSSHVTEFDNIRFTPSEIFSYDLGGSYPDLEDDDAYVKGLDSASSLLESMIQEIEDFWEDDKRTTSASTRWEKQQDGEQALKSSGVQRNDRPSSNQVFVIHGRDEGAKQTVARFLERLGLEPVILHEQANQGRTIIEKFEYHADAQFAVALLTPDDAGSLQGDKNNLSPRARQNVIFELGFFIGRLGREGVCALTKGDVEIPSDYAGVVYILLDNSDGWKMRLIKELKSAGFEVDANKAISP
ncbi:MAG: nucleotide-binding protein [Nitrospira sp.]|nr:nucleotide-binding protein [Nitrospira sp.]